MSHGNTRCGFAALSGMMNRLAIQPATATPTRTSAEIHHRSWPRFAGDLTDDSQLPTPVPTTVAITVVRPSMPLADEILFGRSISGMLPSLAGPNSAAWRPDQRHDDKHQIDVADEDRRDRQRHDDDLGDLAGDDHVALAEAVGQIAGRRRQQQDREARSSRSRRPAPC